MEKANPKFGSSGMRRSEGEEKHSSQQEISRDNPLKIRFPSLNSPLMQKPSKQLA